MKFLLVNTIKPCISLMVGMMGTAAIGYLNSPAPSGSSAILPVGQEQEAITVSERPSLPEPDENGDYRRSPHQTWKVVDSDPQGLNCRMIDMTYNELIDPRKNVKLDIINWPIIGSLKQGQRFKINLGPAGFGIIYDTRNKPWVFVETTDNNTVNQCFVRANNNFIEPVAE